ncbi:hypothetical protein [Streptomyces sp. bgisy153]|uniref:hypothetical protein n=1 Tax=Streptomyces sp. bgisy153 TaxID=3413793 RepID=UPI003D71E9A9
MTETAGARSPACTLAQTRDYEAMHGQCRQTKDIPLPHSTGILLVARCTCSCHGRGWAAPPVGMSPAGRS